MTIETLMSISELYDMLFNVKEIMISFGDD